MTYKVGVGLYWTCIMYRSSGLPSLTCARAGSHKIMSCNYHTYRNFIFLPLFQKKGGSLVQPCCSQSLLYLPCADNKGDKYAPKYGPRYHGGPYDPAWVKVRGARARVRVCLDKLYPFTGQLELVLKGHACRGRLVLLRKGKRHKRACCSKHDKCGTKCVSCHDTIWWFFGFSVC